MANQFVPSDIPLEERTVGKILANRAREYGDKPFVETVEGEMVTYRGLHERSNQFAHGLAAFGIEHQEPVLVMLPDALDFLTVWWWSREAWRDTGAYQPRLSKKYHASALQRFDRDKNYYRIDSI